MDHLDRYSGRILLRFNDERIEQEFQQDNFDRCSGRIRGGCAVSLILVLLMSFLGRPFLLSDDNVPIQIPQLVVITVMLCVAYISTYLMASYRVVQSILVTSDRKK